MRAGGTRLTRCGGLLRVLFLRFVLVHLPNTIDAGEHQTVDDGSRRRENPDDTVWIVGVNLAALDESVRARELRAERESRAAGDFGTEYRFERRAPQRAAGEPGAIETEEGGFGADDVIAAIAVAERNGNDFADQRIAAKPFDFLERDVSRRHVDVVDAGEHELQRTALGADDEIDRRGVALEALVERSGEQQQQRDRGDTERKEQQVQQCRQRAAPGVGVGNAHEIHAAASRS